MTARHHLACFLTGGVLLILLLAHNRQVGNFCLPWPILVVADRSATQLTASASVKGTAAPAHRSENRFAQAPTALSPDAVPPNTHAFGSPPLSPLGGPGGVPPTEAEHSSEQAPARCALGSAIDKDRQDTCPLEARVAKYLSEEAAPDPARLSNFGPGVVTVLCRLLDAENNVLALRALKGLGELSALWLSLELGKGGEEALIRWIDQGKTGSALAARILGEQRVREAVPVLKRLAASKEANISLPAIYALACIGTAEAWEFLLSRLEHSDNRLIRETCLNCILLLRPLVGSQGVPQLGQRRDLLRTYLQNRTAIGVPFLICPGLEKTEPWRCALRLVLKDGDAQWISILEDKIGHGEAQIETVTMNPRFFAGHAAYVMMRLGAHLHPKTLVVLREHGFLSHFSNE